MNIRLALVLLSWLLGVPARADTPFLLMPGYAEATNPTVGAANTLYCYTAPAWGSLTVGSITGWAVTGLTGATLGFGLYPDRDGGTGVVASGSIATGSSGPITASSLSFAVAAGTRYRVCVCASTNATLTYLAVDDTSTNTASIEGLMNAGSLTSAVGTSTNCASGVPSSTTGSLTPANDRRMPFLMLKP